MKAAIKRRGEALACALPRRESLSVNGRGLALWAAIAAIAALQACSATATDRHIRPGTHNIATQAWQLPADRDQVVVATNGTILAIPAGAFMDEMGNTVSGNVDFQVKEANDDVAILTGGLVTRTSNDLLASGGMYMFQALQNGKPLRINPARGIYAYMPTAAKDPAMGLYRGDFNDSKLNWRLTGRKEGGIPRCDESRYTQQQCKRCENLLKMANRIKPKKKPKKDDYYAKRHYWENGVLYFASSGSRKPIMSEATIEECKDYLAATEKGQDMLATIDQYKAEWKDRIGEYYTYKIDSLGWYNIDKVVQDELVTFSGNVVDQDGKPVPGATVHMYCQDKDLKVHTSTTAADGSYTLQFVRGRQFMLYAFEKGRLGKSRQSISASGDVAAVQLHDLAPEQARAFLSDLL